MVESTVAGRSGHGAVHTGRRMASTIAYWIGLLCSACATLFVLTVYGGRYLEELWRGDPLHAFAWSEIRLLAALVMPPLVTCIAILCGWRRDRRHVQDFFWQQIRELERTNDDLGFQAAVRPDSGKDPHTRGKDHTVVRVVPSLALEQGENHSGSDIQVMLAGNESLATH